MRSLKIKFTVVFAVTLALVIIIFSNMIFLYNSRRTPPPIDTRRVIRQLEQNPLFREKFDADEEAAKIEEINEILREKQKEDFDKFVLRVTVPLILLSSIAAYLVASYLVKPIEQLSKNVAGLNPNDLSRRIQQNPASIEIDNLVGSFNDLLSRVEEAFRSQERFIQDAAHELRTPLAGIKANIEALKQKKQVSMDEYRELTDTIEHLNIELINLNETLLFLDRKNEKFSPRSVNICDLIEDVKDSLHHLIESTDANVKISCEEPVRIQADPELFASAIKNIVENSIKYRNGKEPEINIEIVKVNNEVKIRISDNGIGIPEEDLPKVFERFFRGENAYKTEQDGTGLGLSIVKKIIEKHGGSIEIESTVNEGTTFIIKLPPF